MFEEPSSTDRKRLGSWYTPRALIDRVVCGVVDAEFVRRRSPAGAGRVRILDPACGDGRFLHAVVSRLSALTDGDVEADVVGVDIDPDACAAARAALPTARIVCADALTDVWYGADERFDLVIGNPPFLSQMADSTTRGGSSNWGGGPYADAAVEFLGLAARLVDPEGGRVAFVLPQSVLGARDGAPVRDLYNRRSTMVWSWWSAEREFDAQVYTCALGFEFDGSGARPEPLESLDASVSWAHVVTSRTNVPPPPDVTLGDSGVLADWAWLNANFRDEYYALVPVVGDHESGPPLITSGVIDPGRSLWGERSVRFAKHNWVAPRVDVARLDDKMQRWAQRRLVAKVLVANQTSVIEAVCDPLGEWLPGVPVVGIYPNDQSAATAWQIAAVLTSPVASAWAWHRQAGTGLSAHTIRLGPKLLGGFPMPPSSSAQHVAEAVAALNGKDPAAVDVLACGESINRAYGCGDNDALLDWWAAKIELLARRATG